VNAAGGGDPIVKNCGYMFWNAFQIAFCESRPSKYPAANIASFVLNGAAFRPSAAAAAGAVVTWEKQVLSAKGVQKGWQALSIYAIYTVWRGIGSGLGGSGEPPDPPIFSPWW
jgi:hypothetical protein